jgi:hypothetical protein
METPSFRDEVAEVVKLIYGDIRIMDVPREARAEVEFVKNGARLAEAAAAEPVTRAFARAELHPRDDKGLGVYGANLVKALGHQLGEKRLRKLTEEQEVAALHAIGAALASGYVAFMALEPDNPWSLQPDADLRRMWTITLASYRAKGLRDLGLPDEVVRNLEHFGEDAVLAELRRGGVIGRRAGRLGMLGRYYAHAGGFIRATQTNIEMPGRTQLFASGSLDLWPYDEYVAA